MNESDRYRVVFESTDPHELGLVKHRTPSPVFVHQFKAAVHAMEEDGFASATLIARASEGLDAGSRNDSWEQTWEIFHQALELGAPVRDMRRRMLQQDLQFAGAYLVHRG